MISIRIDVDYMRLEINGHSGFGDEGRDIVCAGVSTLVYTLAQNLRMMLDEDEYEADIDTGHAYIEATPPSILAERCRDFFMFTANGFALLEAEYGQYVQMDYD